MARCIHTNRLHRNTLSTSTNQTLKQPCITPDAPRCNTWPAGQHVVPLAAQRPDASTRKLRLQTRGLASTAASECRPQPHTQQPRAIRKLRLTYIQSTTADNHHIRRCMPLTGVHSSAVAVTRAPEYGYGVTSIPNLIAHHPREHWTPPQWPEVPAAPSRHKIVKPGTALGWAGASQVMWRKQQTAGDWLVASARILQAYCRCHAVAAVLHGTSSLQATPFHPHLSAGGSMHPAG
jgi:hypothetical protein